MKKILTAIMAVAVLLSTATVGVSAKTLNPYSEIYSMEHDDAPEAIAEGNLTSGYVSQNGYVGDLKRGGLVYRNVNFGTLTPKKAIVYAGLPTNHDCTIVFKVDKFDGPTLATVKMSGKGDWSTQQQFTVDVELDIEGIHDIWMVCTAGNARIFSFEFLPAEYERETIKLYDGNGNYSGELSEEDKFYCQLIGGLGFKNGKGDTIDTELTVSRGTFASFIDWALNYAGDGEKYFTDVADDHAYSEAINRLKNYNIISGYGDMTFRPDQAITGEEAAVICANALGYNKYSNNEYESKKSQLLLQSGIKDASEPISTLTAMKILYRFFKSDYIYLGLKNFNSFESYEKKHILEETRDIYLETGIIEGNVFSMLDNPSKYMQDGQVSVRGVVYNTPNNEAQRFLGRRCEYFVYKGRDGEELDILSIAPDRKSQSIKITDEAEPYIQNGTLYYTENNKTRKIGISGTTKVIYNSAAYENVDISQILNMQNMKYENGGWVSNGKEAREFKGTIEAVDYEGGNSADVLFVNFYENIVVSGYDNSGKLLYDKLSDRTYFMTGEQEESYAMIFVDGQAVSCRDLKTDMAGIIYKSINSKGKTVILAYFSDDIIDGKITALGKEEIKINSESYDVADDLTKVKNLYMGMTGKFFINPYNEVIWVSTDDALSSSERYAVFIRGAYDEDNDNVFISVWDMEDGIKQYTVKEKIYLEGVRTNNYSQVMNGTNEHTNIGVASLKKGYLLKLKLNSEGLVTFIDSQLKGLGNEKDCIQMVSDSLDGEALIYRWNARIFGNNSAGNKYAISDDTILISCPSPSSEEYSLGDGFSVSSIQTLTAQDQTRDFVLYSTGYKTDVASVVIYYTDKNTDYDKNNLYLFEGFNGEVIGRYEDLCYSVSLNVGGMSKEYVVSPSLNGTVDFSTFVPGTLLKVAKNSYDEIIGIKKLYVPGSEDGVINSNNPESESSINSGTRVILAEVEERDNSFLKLKKRKGDIVTTEYVNTTDIPVYACKVTKRGTYVEKTNAGAITIGKKAIFVLDYGRVKQAIIY